jgi:hypothetical protein
MERTFASSVFESSREELGKRWGNSTTGRSSNTTVRVATRAPTTHINPPSKKFGDEYFSFRDRRGRYDWRALAAIDINKIGNEVTNRSW